MEGGEVAGYSRNWVLVSNGATVYNISVVVSSGTSTTECGVVATVIPAS